MANNPFHDLYLSETITEDALVELFSPVIVEHSRLMFEPGNVIILGQQGTGKTMLLNLLRPESRLAYARAALANPNIKFPLPVESSKFVGAGINLRKCGALEFAQHLEEGTDKREIQELQLLFADFINYLVVTDLIASVQKLIVANNQKILSDVGVDGSKESLNKFSKLIASDQCWFGALDGVENLDQLTEKLSFRVAQYRRFINLNITELPRDVRERKTVIGDPILKTAQALRTAGVLAEDTKVFIRIDQYEQLTTLNVLGTAYGTGCQQLIHKALAARDGRVSYRIGTRRHGWPTPPVIFKTDDVLELKRDFDVIDMDEMWRRKENARTWIFPKFACDIFERRLKGSEFAVGQTPTLRVAAGLSLAPFDRTNRYVSNIEARTKIIEKAVASLPENIPPVWRDYVIQVGKSNLLTAWLCCAWIRQKAAAKKNILPLQPPPFDGPAPWASQPYWQKERIHQALMQIASANRQVMMWSGEDDILSLCGGHLLIFLFLLQHIWDAWLRDKRGLVDGVFKFPIGDDVQSQGIMEASIEWRSKQIEGANARQRKTFVDTLGEHFYKSLIDDRAMSYPGANGISVAVADLDNNPEIGKFLREAASYGDIFAAPHTSKKKGEKRTKYYLAPVFSPFFRIPAAHSKEPEYVKVDSVISWLAGKPEVASVARIAPKQIVGKAADVSNTPTSQQQDLWSGLNGD
jgi:hypothetical protein